MTSKLLSACLALLLGSAPVFAQARADVDIKTHHIRAGLGLLPALPIDVYYTDIVGHVLMFVIGFAMGLFLPRKERDLSNLTVRTMEKGAAK